MMISLAPEVLRLYRGKPGEPAFAHNIRTMLWRIKRSGYDGIEAGTPEGFSHADYKVCLEEAGLQTTAITGLDYAGLQKTLPDILKACEILGASRVLFTSVPPVARGNLFELELFIDRLNQAGKTLLEEGGVHLCFQNKAVDFAQINGVSMMERVVSGTDARYVFFEPNTHWLQAGGGHVVNWLRRLKGRTEALRCMDYSIDPYSDHTFLECTHKRFAEVGTGNLNWPEIFAECKAQGITQFTVAQDDTFMPPYESIALSCANLQKLLA